MTKICDECGGEMEQYSHQSVETLEIIFRIRLLNPATMKYDIDWCSNCIVEAIGKLYANLKKDSSQEQCIHGTTLGDECRECMKDEDIWDEKSLQWCRYCDSEVEGYHDVDCTHPANQCDKASGSYWEGRKCSVEDTQQAVEEIVHDSPKPQPSVDSCPVDKCETDDSFDWSALQALRRNTSY